MKIPINWLKQYVKIPVGVEELASRLTMIGVEVVQIMKEGKDIIFDIEVTPNRPDLLSLLGVAREVSAILGTNLKVPQVKINSLRKSKLSLEVEIQDYSRCPLYTARLMEEVKVFDSPSWLIQKLVLMGLRKVNNIVDITNFCLFETGHPLHAFDYDKIKGKKIIIRNAKKGEKIVTIDNKEHTLTEDDLVIADEKRPIAIAGVIGGKNTEVTQDTKNIAIESAFFDPVTVRKTSRRLGITTESSYRFERGVNLDMLYLSSDRATSLIKENISTTKIGSLLKEEDKKVLPKSPFKIELELEKVREYLDLEIPDDQILKILNSLQIQCSLKGNVIEAIPPGFRGDIEREVDLIEEIARVYGYEKIPSILPIPVEKELFQLKKEEVSVFKQDVMLRSILISLGLDEVISHTLISRENLNKIKYKRNDVVKVKNPLSLEQEVLRPSIIPSLLRLVSSNIRHGQNQLQLFEIGKTYHSINSDSFQERDRVGISLSQPEDVTSTGVYSGELFYKLKGITEAVFDKLGLSSIKFEPSLPEYVYYPGACTNLILDNKNIGRMGYILEEVCNKFDISNNNIVLLELNLDAIRKYIKPKEYKYTPIIKYPTSYRDISFIVDKDIYSSQIIELICNTGGEMVFNVEFLDQYEGEQVPSGKKSLTYRIIYQAKDRTLTDEEVEGAHKRIIKKLEKKLDAQLR